MSINTCENNKVEDQEKECREHQFWDVISYDCRDKADAFVTDESVPPPFCYDEDNLRRMLKSGGVKRYPHNQIPMTQRDLDKLKPVKKWWEIWWFGELNDLRGFYKATFWPFSNNAISPMALLEASTDECGRIQSRFRKRVVLNTFFDAHWQSDAVNGTTGLMMAIQTGILGIVRMFLVHDTNVNVRDNQRNTALHLAVNVIALASTFAREGHYDNYGPQYNSRMEKAHHIVGNLLNHHADVNAVNSRGFTPLMLLCGAGEGAVHSKFQGKTITRSVIGLLMNALADVNLADSDGQTALHHACQRSDIEAVIVLLSATKIDVTAKDARGRTALHTACDIHLLIPYFESQNMSAECAIDHWRVVKVLHYYMNVDYMNYALVSGPAISRDSNGLTAQDMLVDDETPYSPDASAETKEFMISLRLDLLAILDK